MIIKIKLNSDEIDQLNTVIEYLERDEIEVTKAQAIIWTILKALEDI